MSFRSGALKPSQSSNLSAQLSKRPAQKSSVPPRLQPISGDAPAGSAAPPTSAPSKQASAAPKPVSGSSTIGRLGERPSSTGSGLSGASTVGLSKPPQASLGKAPSQSTASADFSQTLPIGKKASPLGGGVGTGGSTALSSSIGSGRTGAPPPVPKTDAYVDEAEKPPVSQPTQSTAPTPHFGFFKPLGKGKSPPPSAQASSAPPPPAPGPAPVSAQPQPQPSQASPSKEKPSSAPSSAATTNETQTVTSPQKPAVGSSASSSSPVRAKASAAATSGHSSPTTTATKAAAPALASLPWPEVDAAREKWLNGRTMEPRLDGMYVGHFPGKGFYACVRCRSVVAGANSKIRAPGGFATFHKYCTANLEYELLAKMQETRILILCQKCKAFLGELTDDGPTETGECFRVNSVALHYCDGNYSGCDGNFNFSGKTKSSASTGPVDSTGRPLQQKGPQRIDDNDDDGEDALAADADAEMFMDEEEVRRKRAAAWGRAKTNIKPLNEAVLTASAQTAAKPNPKRSSASDDSSSGSGSDSDSDSES